VSNAARSWCEDASASNYFHCVDQPSGGNHFLVTWLCFILLRTDTSTAIQSSALSASVIPTAEDETEASFAAAESMLNDVTDGSSADAD
jgi:hypothetical protein